MRTLAVVLAVLALVACHDGRSLADEREQAYAMAAQYAPQRKALLATTEALLTRVRALPAGADVAALIATLDDRRGKLAALEVPLAQLPERVAAAEKGGKRAELRAIVDRTIEDIGGALLAIGNDVANAEREVAALENQAKAAAAAAAAADAGTGDAGPVDAR